MNAVPVAVLGTTVPMDPGEILPGHIGQDEWMNRDDLRPRVPSLAKSVDIVIRRHLPVGFGPSLVGDAEFFAVGGLCDHDRKPSP